LLVKRRKDDRTGNAANPAVVFFNLNVAACFRALRSRKTAQARTFVTGVTFVQSAPLGGR
jgi:hypothetical protein